MNKELTTEEIKFLYKNHFCDDDLINALNIAYNEKDSNSIEYLFFIGFCLDLFTPKAVNILCLYIKETWHNRHEDIAKFLQETKDPNCIDDVVDAMRIKCDYWYDNGDAFIRKCVYILGDLNTPYAIQKLQELMTDENEIIHKYASYQLKKIQERSK